MTDMDVTRLDLELDEVSVQGQELEAEMLNTFRGPKGEKGDKGDRGLSGVELSPVEPTDPDVRVWIDESGEADEDMAIDPTLTLPGHAADAKATGDRLNSLSEDKADKFTVGAGLQMDGGKLVATKEKLKLLRTVSTQEENIKYIFIGAENGQYKLSAIMVKTIMPAGTSTTNGYIDALHDVEGSTFEVIGSAYCQGMVNSAASRTTTFICSPFYGRWFAFSLGSGEAEGNNQGLANYPVKNGKRGVDEYPCIHRIRIRLNEAFPIGAMIELWGVEDDV